MLNKETTTDKSKRIGIFQARWPLQSHTVNSALMLAHAGYHVELFFYSVDTSYADPAGQLINNPNIRIHSFSNSDRTTTAIQKKVSSSTRTGAPFLHRVLKSLWHAVRKVRENYLILTRKTDDLISRRILQETFRIMNDKPYKALIGIEKRGLVWAGQVSRQLKIPYLYHSLELYTHDHSEYMKTKQAKRLKMAEEYYHKGSNATIIQDRRRADVLLRENKVQAENLLYVPISVLGKPYEKRSTYFEERLNIRKDKVLILQFGLILENRLSLELAKLAQSFPENWLLIFHGSGSEEVVHKIREADKNKRVILSLDQVPMEQLQELASSARIGLVLYQKYPLNDYLTAFSSEKLALQLQCGLPIIAFNYPGYEVLENYKCGVLIDSLEELPQAVEQIMSSYDTFRSNAFKCFAEQYEFSKNYQKVIDFLNNL